MNHDRDLFSRLPPQIIRDIAVVACRMTLQGPPGELARLLRVSRVFYGTLCSQHNPGVHARIFYVKFDAIAPDRRYADAGRPLANPNYAHELRRRFICLKRIRSVSNTGKLTVCSEAEMLEDLWMIYLVLIESDFYNPEQLDWAQLLGYFRVLLRDKLTPRHKPEFMIESTPRALGLWLLQFISKIFVVEAPAQANQICDILRPWAFASHKYDNLCAPYTHWALPTSDQPDLRDDLLVGTSDNQADLALRDRTQVVTHMGRRIRLAPPCASIAAIMGYMTRLDNIAAANRTPFIPNPPGQPSQAARSGHPRLRSHPRIRYPDYDSLGTLVFDTHSATYDIDWRRVLQCGDPFATPKFKTKPLFRPGDLIGDWKGSSADLHPDVFQDMLAGSFEAAANGSMSYRPGLVWHIREHHLVSRRRRVPPAGGCESDSVTSEKLPVGRALDAFIPESAQFIHHHDPSEFGTRSLEVRVPEATNPFRYKSYNYISLIPLLDQNAPQQLTFESGDEEFDEDILDTLITGQGHSPAGSFKLQGRIRPWDGMVILIQEYDSPTAQPRARWLYRGYIASGRNLVGRWRETSKEERFSGYEGVFSFTKSY